MTMTAAVTVTAIVTVWLGSSLLSSHGGLFGLFEEMLGNGIEPTVIAYNTAISACEKGHMPGKALFILKDMVNKGIQPSVVTYG